MAGTQLGTEPSVRVQVEPVVEQASELAPFEAVLRRFPDGRLTLVGSGGQWLPPLVADQRLLVARPIAEDETHAQPVRVVDGSVDAAGGVTVVLDGERSRRSERTVVRVATPPLEVRIGPADDGGAAAAGAGPAAAGVLRDISASGARLAHDGDPLPVGSGQVVEVRLAVPDVEDLDVRRRADVVWAGTDGNGRALAGVRFHPADRRTEADLMRWIVRANAAADTGGR